MQLQYVSHALGEEDTQIQAPWFLNKARILKWWHRSINIQITGKIMCYVLSLLDYCCQLHIFSHFKEHKTGWDYTKTFLKIFLIQNSLSWAITVGWNNLLRSFENKKIQALPYEPYECCLMSLFTGQFNWNLRHGFYLTDLQKFGMNHQIQL